MPVRSRVQSFARAGLGVILAVAAGACGNDNATTTSPTTTTAAAVEVYTGTLLPRQLGFYSFQATGSGTASVTFASLTNPATGRRSTWRCKSASAFRPGKGVRSPTP